MRKENNTIQYDKIYIIYVYGCYEDSIFQKHDFKVRDLNALFKKINSLCMFLQ
jgi:hypothetical protein